MKVTFRFHKPGFGPLHIHTVTDLLAALLLFLEDSLMDLPVGEN